MRRLASLLAFLSCLLACLASPASASEVDSEHLFGTTEGSDIGTKGERELELEFAARGGKRSGAYRVLSQVTALKLTLTDSFRVAPLIAFDHHHIRGVPGLLDRDQAALAEMAFEMKYRVLDRQKAPFGLTFVATPAWTFADETAGGRATGGGVHFAALADKELLADRLFAAFNVSYAPGASRPRGSATWEHESALAASAALSTRVSGQVFVSGEVRYERAYDGLTLNGFAGHALFVGPAVYARLTETVWVSALWSAQVAGHAAGDSRALDLVNFERHLVKLRLGIQF